MFEKYETKPLEKIQDPNTGETVNRLAVDPKLSKSIQDEIQRHSQVMQQFVANSQNYFIILKTQMDLLEKIGAADKSIKDTMNDVMKKSKLDMKIPWAWNLQLGVFEYRQPPVVQGMTDAEVKASENPSIPPTITNKEGIGVRM